MEYCQVPVIEVQAREKKRPSWAEEFKIKYFIVITLGIFLLGLAYAAVRCQWAPIVLSDEEVITIFRHKYIAVTDIQRKEIFFSAVCQGDPGFLEYRYEIHLITRALDNWQLMKKYVLCGTALGYDLKPVP